MEGSITSGTHRTVDLVPAFLDALVELDRSAANEILREYQDRISQIKEHTDTLDIEHVEEDEYLFDAPPERAYWMSPGAIATVARSPCGCV